MSVLHNAAGGATHSRETTDGLFVISGDNEWVHVYPDVQTLLDCKDTTTASPGSLEFFDTHGRRLAPVFAAAWTLEGLRVTADRADEGVVRDRLCAVIESVRASIEVRLAQEPNPPGSLEVALARLPELHGRPLPECYQLLAAEFGDGEGTAQDRRPRDDGSAWHNFWCH